MNIIMLWEYWYKIVKVRFWRPLDADMEVTWCYEDIDFSKVMSRMCLLHKQHYDLSSADNVVAMIHNMHEATRQYFKQVHSLLRVILVMLVSSCEAEQSFSVLRWLNTWLQSTIGENTPAWHWLMFMKHSIELPKLISIFFSECSHFRTPTKFWTGKLISTFGMHILESWVARRFLLYYT